MQMKFACPSASWRGTKAAWSGIRVGDVAAITCRESHKQELGSVPFCSGLKINRALV
jgi:hypothetical protein